MDESWCRSLCFGHVDHSDFFLSNLQDTRNYPALVFAERAALPNLHLISSVATISRIVRLELSRTTNQSAIEWVPTIHLDGHHYSLVHLVAGHFPDKGPPPAHFSSHLLAPIPALARA